MHARVNRPIRKIVAFATAAATSVALLMVLSASALANESGTFTAHKTCYVPVVTVSPPNPGGYCLITGSSLAILEGARAYYTDAHVVLGVLSSPVTIKANDEEGSTATGQCTYHLPTATTPGYGVCTYWGGTGELAGFHATYAVGPPLGGLRVYALTGTYWFGDDYTEE